MARCPDGVGSFTVANFPTFKLSNCAIGVNELSNESHQIKIFPNPAHNYFAIRNNSNKPENFIVYNTLGEQIYKSTFTNNATVNTSAWTDGIYFVRTDFVVKKIIVNH